ncbi:MAG: hypothetical protein EOM25_01765 [Deltaproteobacteria bacterium]|nr:hypothetical protein [Deltaproteobacteria bacterium]
MDILIKSEQGMPPYLNNIPIGILLVNAEHEICGVNTAAVGMLGMEEHDICELINTPDPQRLNCHFWQSLSRLIKNEENGPFFISHYSVGKGESKYLIVNSSEVALGDHVHGHVVCIDVITHEQLKGLKDYAILNSSSALHKDRSEALLQLSQSVSHQILNPIMSISGFSRLVLKNEGLDSICRKHMQVIVKEAIRLESIVKALSSYAGMNPKARKRIVLDELIHAMEETLSKESALKARPHSLNVKTEGKTGHFWGEPRLITIAFQEIMKNCVDFSWPEKVSVSIKVEGEAQGLTFRIEDQGMGLRNESVSFVFDPFFSTKPDGIGMGLTRARRGILEHRGDIDFKSELGKGSTVTLFIPQRQRQNQQS